MNRRFLLFFILALIVIAFWTFVLRQSGHLRGRGESPLPHPSATIPGNLPATPEHHVSPSPQPSSVSLSPNSDSMKPATESAGGKMNAQTAMALVSAPLDIPNQDQLRNEVSRDPHVTPPALISFAQRLAAHTEAAKSSPEAAQVLFDQLEACLSDRGQQSAAVQAQTLCLSTAQELAGVYPDQLKDRTARLEANAPAGVKRLQNAIRKFE